MLNEVKSRKAGKNLFILGLFILSLVFVQFAQAQTVDEVINNHIKSLGGKENLQKIQSIVMQGSLSVQGAEIAITFTQVKNKLARQDIQVMGMTGYDFITDKEGWSYMPFQGMQKPESKTADEVKENQGDLDVTGPMFDYAAKGHKVELLGKEVVEGTECYKIKASQAGGKEVFFFIDPVSYMIVRQKETRKFNGQEAEVSIDYSDYKDVEGVKMPYSIIQQFGTVLISSIKFNQAIPESLYKHDQ